MCPIYKNYYKYFLWNKALINHYFSKEKEDILLYVDKQLLEEIGKKEGIEKDYSEEEETKILSDEEVTIFVDMHMGDAQATAWGCDLTYDYVSINADYRS